jgi:UDP-GlcNAc:undecaprenyl-phosphate/decaprenyl-phosphate GlcNAc-1-phosphate transferase
LVQIYFPLLFLIAALSASVALIVTYYVRQLAVKHKIGSFPDARMVHTGFVPRLGGLGIYAGFIAGLLLSYFLFPSDSINTHYFFILLGTLLIVGIGVYDDFKGLNAPQKFLGQIIAASLVIFSGCTIDVIVNPFGPDLPLGIMGIPITYLWIIGVTNAVNLLDGLDGLAAGVSFIVSLVLITMGFVTGNITGVLFGIALAGAILGFLRYNYHPASIFMGDTGSLFLGFILATLSLKSFENSSSKIAMLLPLIALAIPIGDTAVSFFRRLNKGKHPFKPDKDHLHHRLIYLGLTHKQAVQIIYMLSFAYGLTALLMALNIQILGFVMLIISITFSVLGLKRLGYLEARKGKTVYGDHASFLVENELAPLSIKRFLHRILLGISDIITLNLSMVVFIWIRFKFGLMATTTQTFEEILSLKPLLMVTLTWLILFVLNDLYTMRWDISRFDKARRISKTILFGILIFFIATWDNDHIISQSRLTIVLYAILLIGFVNFGRLLVIGLEKKFSILEYAPQNTLLIGATEKSRKLLKDIRKNRHLLYNVIGFVSKDGNKESFSDLKSLGSYDDIPEIIRSYGVMEVIIAINERSRDEILSIIASVKNMKVVFKIIPQFYDVVSGHKTEEVIGHPLIRLFPDHMHLWQWLLKRTFDVIFSIILLLVFLPLGLLIYFILLVSGANPRLNIVNSVGKNAQIFGMLNFNVLDKNSTIQQMLYKSNLYKFPELVNILIGKMSFVGPRPEPPEIVSENSEKIRFYNRRFQIRPGLTGWAQVKYRYDDSLKSKREQYKQDLFYLENMSLTFDFRILLRSLFIILTNKF